MNQSKEKEQKLFTEYEVHRAINMARGFTMGDGVYETPKFHRTNLQIVASLEELPLSSLIEEVMPTDQQIQERLYEVAITERVAFSRGIEWLKTKLSSLTPTGVNGGESKSINEFDDYIHKALRRFK